MSEEKRPDLDAATIEAFRALGIDPRTWAAHVEDVAGGAPDHGATAPELRASRERLVALIAAVPDALLRERLYRLVGARERALLPDADERNELLGNPETG